MAVRLNGVFEKPEDPGKMAAIVKTIAEEICGDA